MTDYVPSPELQARVVARRGQLHAFSHMAPQRTALVVVDMQNAFVKKGAGHAWVPAAAATCGTINRLAEALRHKGGTVVWILNTFTEESLQSWSHFHENLSSPAGLKLRSETMSAGHDSPPTATLTTGFVRYRRSPKLANKRSMWPTPARESFSGSQAFRAVAVLEMRPEVLRDVSLHQHCDSIVVVM